MLPVWKLNMKIIVNILWICVLAAAVSGCGENESQQRPLVMPEPFGFGPPDYVDGGLISITYKSRIAPEAPRSRDEAASIVVDIHDKIKAGKITFEEAAEKFSDSPTAEEGGHLGIVHFEDVVPIKGSYVLYTLKPGDISKVVEGESAFYIFKAFPFERRYFKMILLRFGKTSPEKRTREEANSMIEKIYRDITEGRKTFEQAADENSELSSAPGGYIGLVLPGTRGKLFDTVSKGLKIGEITIIFEDRNYIGIAKRCEPVFYTFSYIVFPGNTTNDKLKKKYMAQAEEFRSGIDSVQEFYDKALEHMAKLRWDTPWYKVSKDLFKDNLHKTLYTFFNTASPGDFSDPILFDNGVYIFLKEEPIGRWQ